MVNWLVGTTDRFRAAVSENGVTNQIAGVGQLATPAPSTTAMALLGDPLCPEGIDKLWRQSPLRNVANVRTPLLMLQAEADLRCPAADNEQFFIALRVLRPDRRVRPLSRGVPRVRHRGPARPPDRPA